MHRIRIGVLLLAGLLSAPPAHGDAPQLGARPADAWVKLLDSPQRVAGLKIDEVVARLGLRPGNTVADIGAGAGAWEGALAGAVSPSGSVYAVDIDQGLLDHIAARATQVGLTNVRVVLGKYTDPALPVRNVDLALIYDVLHHIEARAEYLKNLALVHRSRRTNRHRRFHPRSGRARQRSDSAGVEGAGRGVDELPPVSSHQKRLPSSTTSGS